MSFKTKIILALADMSTEESIDLLSIVGDRCYAVKMHDISGAEGESTVRGLLCLPPKRVWIDVKVHDIPRTAASRTAKILKYGPRIISAHAAGGVEMMKAVAGEVHRYGPEASAWTSLLLTSLDEKEIERSHGGDRTRAQILLDYARMAHEAGMDGVICAPREVGMLKTYPDFEHMTFIAVGIRPEGIVADDQKRYGTPQEAVENGADFMVIGRAVTKAKNPMAMFNAIAFDVGVGA